MSTHILMNLVDGQEMRIAMIRSGRLEALIHDRITDDRQFLGSIYKAKVANVEPSLDAAFLDLGSGKNGFIHVDEIRHDKGDRARIENIIRAGDELVVQVTKEAIKDKGPCVSTYLSLAGRYLVMMSGSERGGVSKRIEDPADRKRLKKLLSSFEAPDDFSYIVRTAGAQRDDDELQLDRDYLARLWSEISGKIDRVRGPACVYHEGDVVLRTLRDLVPVDVESVVIDQEDLYDEARAFCQVFMPEVAGRIQLHREELPLFTYYGVEERLASIMDREVRLPSGGAIVIEQTEALVSIDVNSSRNKSESDVAKTAFMTNIEAVGSIAEQLVLRDLGGLVIIDFIDMESREDQRMVQLALRRAIATDKARTQVSPMSRFGLVEMTRQRTRPSHKLVSSTECPYCRGTGAVKTSETFEIEVLRALRSELGRKSLSRIEVVVPADLAVAVLNGRRKEISRMEDEHDCRIQFVGDNLMKAREFRLVASERKRARRRGKAEEPVRPQLLAPMLEERAKALAEAKSLASKRPAELERELLEMSLGQERPQERSEAKPELVQVSAATIAVAPKLVLADELRRLLFTPASPVAISAGGAALATGKNAAKSPRSSRGRRVRRRR
ncbi:MAG: Rne/Rng family ribonuclease [Planctomycetota bacterium]|jgi:ribonuclease E|nr:Rne/Rng family ribonuclease [Planctomycetota bacterium]